jgi:hypothetical protein
MKEIGHNNRITDRPTKDASTSKQDATIGKTNSWNSWQRCMALAKYQRTAMEYAQTGADYAKTAARTSMDYTQSAARTGADYAKTAIEYAQKYAVPIMKYMLTYGLLATAPMLTDGRPLMRQDEASTDLGIGYGHSSLLGQRDTLLYPLESTGVAISDFWRQHQNIEHDEFSQSRASNVELHQPPMTDIERLQDHEFQREILSACQNPEYAAVEMNSMPQDKDYITPLSDLCRDPIFKNTFAALAQDKKFIRNISPLFIENFQRVLDARQARQEEARSHNLDTTREPFKRQQGVGRRLLRSIDDCPDSTAKYEEKHKQGSDNEVSKEWLIAALAAALVITIYNYSARNQRVEQLQKEKHELEVKYLQEKIYGLKQDKKSLITDLKKNQQDVVGLKFALLPRVQDLASARRIVQRPMQPPEQKGQAQDQGQRKDAGRFSQAQRQPLSSKPGVDQGASSSKPGGQDNKGSLKIN